MAGAYLQQYEVYYKRLDPEGKAEIGAMQVTILTEQILLYSSFE